MASAAVCRICHHPADAHDESGCQAIDGDLLTRIPCACGTLLVEET